MERRSPSVASLAPERPVLRPARGFSLPNTTQPLSSARNRKLRTCLTSSQTNGKENHNDQASELLKIRQGNPRETPVRRCAEQMESGRALPRRTAAVAASPWYQIGRAH